MSTYYIYNYNSSSMDSDIEVALRLQADGYDINDEDTIQLLLNECHSTSHYDIDEILEETFYMNNNSPTIRYSFTSQRYHNAINELNTTSQNYNFELINDHLQNTLIQRYNLQNHIGINNNNKRDILFTPTQE